MNTSDKKLNKEQLEAIEYGDGPLLIIAGAGTGKTTVITERVKHLISSGRAKPEEILALTFTEKGAREMEERIDVALPYGYTQMWVMTFHGFCDQILRDNAIHIGLSPSYKLMTEAQSIDLIRKNLFDLDLNYFRPLGNPNKFIDGLLQHFSRLQDELVSPDEYLKFANEEISSELSNAYQKYNNLKIRENVMDFGDLITNTIKLFKDRPNILKTYHNKFKYILVDEFQDTNFAQNELLKLLAGKLQNITVVGDDSQSIYKFRGAAISNILQFKKTYPKTKFITLNKNYRSTQPILDSAYKLIKHNDPDTLEVRLGISKELKAITGKENSEIKFIHTESVSDESSEVVNEITQLTKKYDYKDVAILVRANAHADPFIRELERQGIPHQFLGPSSLFGKEEIVDLISYLKILYNPEDNESFYRFLSSDTFDINPLDLIKISSDAKKKSLSIFEIISNAENETIKNLLTIINKHLKMVKNSTAGEILYDYINEVGLLEKLVENSDDIKAKNIAKFFEKIKEYEDQSSQSVTTRRGVSAFVDYVDLLLEVGESPNVTDGNWQENNAVNILTVHSSKGLEFPVVFLVNLVSERFPSRARHEQIPIPDELIKEVLPEGDFHLQEERRLFYVGMTRAKEKLYFSASDYYGDGKRKKKISPFVYEALGEVSITPARRDLNLRGNSKIEEIKVEKNKFKINYLSVSQIEAFESCPLHYKLKYIYKLPTKANASISFGISIHKTLKDFIEVKGGILDIYKNNWIEEGYLNKKHKLEFYKLGEKYLLDYVDKNKRFNNIALEQSFKFKLDKTLTLGGTIDRIDKVGDTYEILDYKTGDKIPTQKEVDKNLQLSVYAMAVSEIYKVKPENIKLTLYYLKDQTKISTKRTTKDLEKVKEEILKIRDEIEASDFKCNNNFFCQGKCEYSMFCKSKT